MTQQVNGNAMSQPQPYGTQPVHQHSRIANEIPAQVKTGWGMPKVDNKPATYNGTKGGQA